MNASDVMVSAVITVKPDATVQEAAQLMLANRVSGLPVVDDSAKLVGLISEGDLLRRAAEETWPKAWGPPPRGFKSGEDGWNLPYLGKVK